VLKLSKFRIRKIAVCFCLIGFLGYGQKPQKIAFIDMEYILEHVPSYVEAEKKLGLKANQWRNTIEKNEKEISRLRSNLYHEKILLTEELVLEKEQEIKIKEFELKKLQAQYFGAEGSLFLMRQQLVQPIQDQVFNAIQTIVKRKKYDFVIDRSSDFILLHANPKFDISKLVIKYMTQSEKEIKREETRLRKAAKKEALQKRIEAQKQKRLQAQKEKEASNSRTTEDAEINTAPSKETDAALEKEAAREALRKRIETLKLQKIQDQKEKEASLAKEASNSRTTEDAEINTAPSKETDAALEKEAAKEALRKRIEALKLKRIQAQKEKEAAETSENNNSN
jgi:Skp family chaperone for outer membrane proteins